MLLQVVCVLSIRTDVENGEIAGLSCVLDESDATGRGRIIRRNILGYGLSLKAKVKIFSCPRRLGVRLDRGTRRVGCLRRR